MPSHYEYIYYLFYEPASAGPGEGIGATSGRLLYAEDQPKIEIRNRAKFFREVMCVANPKFFQHNPNGSGSSMSTPEDNHDRHNYNSKDVSKDRCDFLVSITI